MTVEPAALNTTAESRRASTRSSPNVLDLQPPSNRASQLRRIPELTFDALAVVWAAARGHLVATILLQAAAAAAFSVQLLIGKEIFSGLVAVGNGASVDRLYPWFAALAAFGALLGALGAFAAHEQKLLVELTARHAFEQIVSVSAAVDYASFEDPEFHDHLERARYSGLYRTIDMVNSVSALTTGILMSAGIAGVLLLLQPLLLLFVALAAIVPLIATIHNSRKTYSFEYALTPESRERLYLLELLTEREAAKEIRAFDAAPFLRRRFVELNEERLRRLNVFLRGRLRVSLLGSLAGLVGTAIALGALLLLLARGVLPVATAMTAGLAMQQLGSRLNSVTASVGKLIESGMFVDDYRAFLALVPQRPANDAAPAQPRRAPGFAGLRVEDVSFAYPGSSRLALDGASLEVKPGEVVALVGENGSGKTTLVKLISQLYRPAAGRVLWNGRDATALDPEEIRDELTILFQDYIQYYLAAQDNIVLGRSGSAARPDQVTAAAARAGAHEFLSALPEGYETRLGKQFYGGHELSVGQWQRLALARAFFRGGSFLVLDEPTASLDPRAESELYAQMRELARGRSVLLVSHRFSSVRSADRIYVLEEGRSVESGTHDDLLAEGGRYAELFALQAQAYLADASAV